MWRKSFQIQTKFLKKTALRVSGLFFETFDNGVKINLSKIIKRHKAESEKLKTLSTKKSNFTVCENQSS